MLLRQRLALLLAVTLVLALGASVVLADVVFGHIQQAQSVATVERELRRVQAVVRARAVGEDIIATGPELSAQFVAADGRVVLPEPEAAPLPLRTSPTTLRDDLGPRLVASAPWLLPSGQEVGTIRVALDLSGAEALRLRLRRSLVLSGAGVALLALVVALASLRTSLAPLLALAREADRVDPAAPRMAPHVGPCDEVARVAEALERALAAVRERQQAERDALAEVAHELAAPLTVVAGQLRSLAAAHPDDRRLLGARAAADELLHTSQDLFTLARGELDAPPELRVVDAHDVVAQLAAEYPEVVIERAPGDLRVLADRDRLRQVVRNLVRNAVQAAGDARGVLVRVGHDGEAVTIAVEDDGPGVAPDALPQVFERYYRGAGGAGAGVGLTVAQRIVASLDGTIAAAAASGSSGAVFEVRLPTLASRLDEPDGGAPDGAPSRPGGAAWDGASGARRASAGGTTVD